ncbi:ABC-2 type transporter family protein [Cryptosporidium muris RN66]|uniref:ABC-2 type transporter family protein n=1 Tax=Cryptosporidium muris (strain RN66) TaxID=441375 RepID=B6AJM5_CRYMR|nr:ABC-2 type transporter family protein [Cryptosporidium muris RN66]EEA08416.1 ABC-2 type transporter family protein [Cryptosporidium muris RN66]|eukprot:XP_002142765.1 ABC-2 type transporter family protein [Cryptosporidium muris RN66]
MYGNPNSVPLPLANFRFETTEQRRQRNSVENEPQHSNIMKSLSIYDYGVVPTNISNYIELNSSRGGDQISSLNGAKGGSSAAAIRRSITDESLEIPIHISGGLQISKRITLITKDLSVYTTYKEGLCSGKKKMNILKSVNFIATPGQFIGIMGISGSGKSTLLNALSGRLKASNFIVTGSILVNGYSDIDLSYLTRLVLQKDFMLPYLTVRETMDIAAGLRLPHHSKKERNEKIEEILDILGLLDIQSTLVGGISSKGLSGGEIKRLSIAIELLQGPPVLFLDEPTTGLDAARAYDLMDYLANLAHSTGMIIICSIHTPRSQAFSLFDKVLVLSKGLVVGQGSPMDVLTFYNDVLTIFPKNYNPADFIIDAISLVELAHKQKGAEEKLNCEIIDNKIRIVDNKVNEEPLYEFEKLSSINETSNILFGLRAPKIYSLEDLNEIYEHSIYGENVTRSIEHYLRYTDTNHPKDLFETLSNIDSANMRPLPNRNIFLRILYLSPIPSPIQFFREVSLLTKRASLNNWRNPKTTIGLLFVNTILGIIMGGIFFALPKENDKDSLIMQNARNIVGFIFFFAVGITFTAIKGLVNVVTERFVMNRETFSQMYTPLSYFISIMISDFPLQHLQAFIYCTIVYFMAGVYNSDYSISVGQQFGLWTLITQVGTFSAYSFGYILSSIASNPSTVFNIFPMANVIFFLLAGYFLNLNQIPVWINWFGWLSTCRYLFTGMFLSIFIPGQSFVSVTTDFFINQYALWTESYWKNLGTVFGLGIAMRILAYIFFAFLLRNKQLAS